MPRRHRNYKQQFVDDSASDSSLSSSSSDDEIEQSFAANANGVIYYKPTCPHCRDALARLDINMVECERVDVTKNPQNYSRMLQHMRSEGKSTDHPTVPQIWIKNKYIGGADALRTLFPDNNDDMDAVANMGKDEVLGMLGALMGQSSVQAAMSDIIKS